MRRVFTTHSCVFVISLLLISSSVSIKLSNQETSTPNETLCQLSATPSSSNSDEFDNTTLSDKYAHAKTDLSPTYGVYDRSAAYNYAQKYWDEVCSDGYFVNTRTTYIQLDPGTDITGMTGYDCAHFVSCCIGNEPHEPGGGLDVPNTASHIYGELGATQLGDWLITSDNGVEKPTISELMMGDVINYDWDGDGHWDHAALYLGSSEVAGHTTCVWEADWQLIGAADYRFIHIPASPWIVDDDGSADFHTIQEAINVASDGDTIFVKNGIYYEHLIVNKSLRLIGENRLATIIDGSGNGEIVDITANNMYVSNFLLQNAGFGVYGAVWVHSPSTNAVIYNTTMIDNRHGVAVETGALNVTIQDNLIFNRQPSYADAIRLFSSGTLVIGNKCCNQSTAIGLDWAYNNTIQGNTVINNYIGIGAGNSSYDNVFRENTIANNSYGFLTAIYDSQFFHNNIINNNVQAAFYSSDYTNTWDNNCEGNYWSDYYEINPNASCNEFGIWNTSYLINDDNIDRFPLRNPYWNPADINHDLTVDIFDVVAACITYMSTPEDLHWNCHCDLAEPYGIINIFDIVMICTSYGEEWG